MPRKQPNAPLEGPEQPTGSLLQPNVPMGPYGSPVATWTGYPTYRGTDKAGNTFQAYGRR